MVGNERWHFVRQAYPEEREWLDRAAMIRVGFGMLPRQPRIARVWVSRKRGEAVTE